MQDIYIKKYLKYKTKYLTTKNVITKYGGVYCTDQTQGYSIYDIKHIALNRPIASNAEHVDLHVTYKNDVKRDFVWQKNLGSGGYGVVSHYKSNTPELNIVVKIGTFGPGKEAYNKSLNEELQMTNMLSAFADLRPYLIEAKGLYVNNGDDILKVIVMDMYEKPLYMLFYVYVRDESKYKYIYELAHNANKLMVLNLFLRIMNAMFLFYQKNFFVFDAKLDNILLCKNDIYFADFGSFVQFETLNESHRPTYCLATYKYTNGQLIMPIEFVHMGFCVILLLDMIGYPLKDYYQGEQIPHYTHTDDDLVVARALFMENFTIENAHDYNAKLQQLSDNFITNYPTNGYSYSIGKLTELITSLP